MKQLIEAIADMIDSILPRPKPQPVPVRVKRPSRRR